MPPRAEGTPGASGRAARIPTVKFRVRDWFSKRPEQPEAESPTVVQIDATSLSRVFSAPMWLRDLGLLAWFLVGVSILLVGATWLAGLTATITMPVIVGLILATVASPLVDGWRPTASRALLVPRWSSWA